MGKNKDVSVARVWYVEKGQTAKEIAKKLHYTEKTIGAWVKKYAWKEERNARENSKDARINNIKEVIDGITEDRKAARTRLNELKADLKQYLSEKDKEMIEITRDMMSDIRKEIVNYDDAISKWNKTLENFDKENMVSLSAYLHVMDEIFKDLQNTDSQLYIQSLDFQEQHITKVSLKLG